MGQSNWADKNRNDEPLSDSKLDAPVTFVRKMMNQRGFLEENDVQAFQDGGYSKRQVLEVNLIIALKTISNYTNHLAKTPLDDPFKAENLNSNKSDETYSSRTFKVCFLEG